MAALIEASAALTIGAAMRGVTRVVNPTMSMSDSVEGNAVKQETIPQP